MTNVLEILEVGNERDKRQRLNYSRDRILCYSTDCLGCDCDMGVRQTMGMTIDKAISHLYTYSSTMGSGQTTQAQHEESKRVAIEIMRKYQKIVSIVSLNDEEFKQCGLKELKEILEVIADGAINSSDCIRP